MLSKKLPDVSFSSSGEEVVKGNYVPTKSAVIDHGNNLTSISLDSYHHTKGGLMMRQSGESELIGYCTENPLEVLKRAFKDYHVTRFSGYEFFSSDDFRAETPMIGLGISSIPWPYVYGIVYNGELEELLRIEKLEKARRQNPISGEEIQIIIDELTPMKEIWHNPNYVNPNYERVKHDLGQITEVLRGFV